MRRRSTAAKETKERNERERKNSGGQADDAEADAAAEALSSAARGASYNVLLQVIEQRERERLTKGKERE
jgi:hypothetical protein